MVKKWVVLFSQSGQEIADISKALGRKPDLVLTNNLTPDRFSKDMSELLTSVPLIASKHDSLMLFLRNAGTEITLVPENTIITLHGYLRILPPDVCNTYEIYNGHPGLITHYPELKGKDPQEKVIKEPYKFDFIGSVVHHCTPELDGGDVIESSYEPFPVIQNSKNIPLDEIVYNKLRKHSLNAWKQFLKNKL